MFVTLKRAHEIAEAYQQRWRLKGAINADKSSFYDSFYRVQGAVWLVILDMPPTSFEGGDEVTIVVSIDQREVHHIITRSGFDKYPHMDG